MARGWESKEVESQIEAAEDRRARAKKLELNAATAKWERERDSIELSRVRVLQDLVNAKNPGYSKLLQQSLQFLDEKLALLNRENR